MEERKIAAEGRRDLEDGRARLVSRIEEGPVGDYWGCGGVI